jgi:hypothetical protein
MTESTKVPALVHANFVTSLPLGAWLVVVAVLLAAATLVHPLLPRYDVRVIGQDPGSVLIYDKWTGRLQRAHYTPEGSPVLTGVVTPF